MDSTVIVNVSQFLSIAIVGVGASLIVEAITNLAKTSPFYSKVTAVAVSIVLGTGYYFASHTIWWTTVLAILGVASTVYALFFNRNDSTPAPTL